MIRRTKDDVERDLPPKRETKLFIGMTPIQKEWYTRMLSKDVGNLNIIGGEYVFRYDLHICTHTVLVAVYVY